MLENDTSGVAREVARRCMELGETQVRQNLATGLFTDEWRPHAERWLANLDHERKDASQAESLTLARSANAAAWAAARAAKTANTIATLALAAAMIAMALSIIGLSLG